MTEEFELASTTWGDNVSYKTFAHKTKPVWVVFYDKTKIRAAYYQAYKPTAPLKVGRHPCMGGVDNRRIGGEDGFDTLEEACAAAMEAA